MVRFTALLTVMFYGFGLTGAQSPAVQSAGLTLVIGRAGSRPVEAAPEANSRETLVSRDCTLRSSHHTPAAGS